MDPNKQRHICVSYICSGPQLLDDHLYPVHHLFPHSCLLWSRRHEVIEVHHLLMESAQEKNKGYSHHMNTYVPHRPPLGNLD